VVKVIAPAKINALRYYAERHGEEHQAIWLVHPQHVMWGEIQPICFHRVDDTGRPMPLGMSSSMKSKDLCRRRVTTDTDGTLVPTDEYGEPCSRYYSYALFGFH
jgi:hypothetical protein